MRNALHYVLYASAVLLAGCSGGSTDSSSSVRIRCLGGQAFCIISCDLGCTQTGCSVTEIAENQRLRFKFSDRVDPQTVNGSSISIRTASGVAPDGEFLVQDNEVVFVPTVRTVNGISSFGFQRNETYILTLAGGDSIAQSVKNLAGDGLSQEFSCSVVASLGILDEDQQPPTAQLISPVSLVGAPVNPTVVIRFSELIDTTPLQVSLSEASPIRVTLRGQLPNGQCDVDSSGIALTGVPQLATERVGSRDVTVVTWQPSVQLPGQSCLTVRVTADLRDLSGRSAVPARWDILTVAGVSVPITINENFTSSAGQEQQISGGVWGGSAGPGARPGLIGGDGRHGSFDPALGNPLGGGVFEWNTDSFLIPMSSSLTGLEYLVTDGRFYFTDMVIPSGTTIRFTGTVPPVIRVRGQVDIQGRIEINGQELPWANPPSGIAASERVSTFNARNSIGNAGQPGTNGGCGGGRGGNGGQECTNTGPTIVAGVNLTNGQPGENVRLPAGHAYAAQAGGTGGAGGTLTPATGISGLPPPSGTLVLISNIYLPYFCTGGAGGGFSGPGGAPDSPVLAGAVPPISEPPAVPGVAFPLLPYPASPPANYSSLNHFVVGGSGGGGGGSHGFGLFGFPTQTERWMAGHAGTGGGGAMAIRAGGVVTIGSQAVLEAKGGRGVLINGDNPLDASINTNNGISSPGGGGSGGSFLIQSGQNVSVAGAIDTSGAEGSRVGLINTAQINISGQGGDGSPGFFRLEAAGNVAFGGTSVPAFVQANNTGPLADRDDLSGDTSTWRATGLVFPPTWLRYELDVDLDGDGTIDVTYTDSGEPGTVKAYEIGGPVTLPVTIEFQGGNVTVSGGEPDPASVGPWRPGIGAGSGPGINIDSVTGFRFTMTYNRGLFPNMVVRQLRVFAQS